MGGFENIGHRLWAIAEGYIPGESHGPAPEMTSHETACVLNAGDHDAHVDVMIFFKDRDPVGPFEFTVKARRTSHVRFNDFKTPTTIPRNTDFSSVLKSDVPIVVQHSRLDSRNPPHALLSTIAFAVSAD